MSVSTAPQKKRGQKGHDQVFDSNNSARGQRSTPEYTRSDSHNWRDPAVKHDSAKQGKGHVSQDEKVKGQHASKGQGQTSCKGQGQIQGNSKEQDKGEAGAVKSQGRRQRNKVCIVVF